MNIKVVRALLILSLPILASAADHVTVKATNKLQAPRASQTIEISGKDLEPLQAKGLNLIHVKDSDGKEVLCQAVDTDFNELHKPSIVIFQADFAPGETKTFTLTAGKKQVYKAEDSKAYGRLGRDARGWRQRALGERPIGGAD